MASRKSLPLSLCREGRRWGSRGRRRGEGLEVLKNSAGYWDDFYWGQYREVCEPYMNTQCIVPAKRLQFPVWRKKGQNEVTEWSDPPPPPGCNWAAASSPHSPSWNTAQRGRELSLDLQVSPGLGKGRHRVLGRKSRREAGRGHRPPRQVSAAPAPCLSSLGVRSLGS